jgi:ATP synthase subunit 6
MSAPLEQFRILGLLPISLFNIDISVTNFLLNTIFIFSVFALIPGFSQKQGTYDSCYYHIPRVGYQSIIELINKIAIQIIYSNLNKKGEKFYPYISTIFFLILTCNLIGLIPYNVTITSHILVTFFLSFSLFFSVNSIGFDKHSFKMFSLIIPANSNLTLAVILVPIDFISYLAKPISLGVRLFINMMAGHTLLKVILGFSWSLLLMNTLLCNILHLIPLCLLVVLLGLELGVALIQAYVFSVLTCIYLNDSINLH